MTRYFRLRSRRVGQFVLRKHNGDLLADEDNSCPELHLISALSTQFSAVYSPKAGLKNIKIRRDCLMATRNGFSYQCITTRQLSTLRAICNDHAYGSDTFSSHEIGEDDSQCSKRSRSSGYGVVPNMLGYLRPIMSGHCPSRSQYQCDCGEFLKSRSATDAPFDIYARAESTESGTCVSCDRSGLCRPSPDNELNIFVHNSGNRIAGMHHSIRC